MGTPPKELTDLPGPLAPAELVERESQLAALAGLLRVSREGGGNLAVVEGPAGIGKTRLVREAAEQARGAGARVLSARGGEFERDFSYGIVRQLFEPLLAGGGAAGLLGGAAALARPLFDLDRHGLEQVDPSHGTLHGLFWLVANAAAEETVVMVVDDAQWCDPPSLRFLAYLAHRLDGLGVLLIVTVRTRDTAVQEAILDNLATDPAATVLNLEPLSAEAVSELVEARLGVVPDPTFTAAVHAGTAGNPLLVRELVGAALAERVDATAEGARRVGELAPERVARLVLRRVAPLGPRALALAQALAVLGDAADLAEAAEVAGLPQPQAASAARALQGIEVLGRGGPALAFAHPVVRRAVYDGLPPSECERGHARAAEVLAARGAPSARVAGHLVAVAPQGDPAVVRLLRDAARQALAQGAPDASARYLERALAEPPDTGDRTTLLLQLGVAQVRCRPAVGVEQLMRVLELADDDATLADAAAALATALHQLARDQEWQAAGERVLERLSDGRAVQRVESYLIWYGAFRPESFAAAAARLHQIRPGQCGEDVGGRLLLGLLASFAARAGTAPARALELAQDALANGALVECDEAPSYAAAASVLVHLDRFGEALAVFDRVGERARRIGSPYHFAMTSWLRADLMLRRGELAEAEADAQSALEALPSARHGWRTLGEIAVERGDSAYAARCLDALAVDEEPPGSWIWSLGRATRGRVRAALGDVDGALGDLLSAGSALQALGVANPAYAAWRSTAALLIARRGDRARAVALAREEVDLARAWKAPRSLGRALRMAGLVEGGRDGTELLGEAVDALSGSDALLERAYALTDWGAALRRHNQRARAREPLATALELAERCGAERLAERARAELVATGARPRRAMRRGVEALTPSERRVAGLAAGGRTNREIAQALFVTPKTVEVHLSHAYRKLGVSSRSQLAGALGAVA